MKLYHGSTVIVEKPEIRISERFLDFGCGFYTTSNREQAVAWCNKQKSKRGADVGYVSVYDFDDVEAKKVLKKLEFSDADDAWLRFVCDNRRGACASDYDIVVGPVADDNVYEVVRLYENGVYELEDALKRLKIERLYVQTLFHTPRSLSYLHYSGSEKL